MNVRNPIVILFFLRLAAGVFCPGAIFLGPLSRVEAGDFLAGPSHELPTGGAGKAFAG